MKIHCCPLIFLIGFCLTYNVASWAQQPAAKQTSAAPAAFVEYPRNGTLQLQPFRVAHLSKDSSVAYLKLPPRFAPQAKNLTGVLTGKLYIFAGQAPYNLLDSVSVTPGAQQVLVEDTLVIAAQPFKLIAGRLYVIKVQLTAKTLSYNAAALNKVDKPGFGLITQADLYYHPFLLPLPWNRLTPGRTYLLRLMNNQPLVVDWYQAASTSTAREGRINQLPTPERFARQVSKGDSTLKPASDCMLIIHPQGNENSQLRYTSYGVPKRLTRVPQEAYAYLMPDAEYAKLAAATKGQDKLIERFWKEVEKKAKRPKNGQFLGRLQQANTNFTTLRPGWQTDRGMAWILFGRPDVLRVEPDQEVWRYKTPARVKEPLELTFTNSKNPLLVDEAELQANDAFESLRTRAAIGW